MIKVDKMFKVWLSIYPFHQEETCDDCGIKGAYYLIGDHLCLECCKKEYKSKDANPWLMTTNEQYE